MRCVSKQVLAAAKQQIRVLRTLLPNGDTHFPRITSGLSATSLQRKTIQTKAVSMYSDSVVDQYSQPYTQAGRKFAKSYTIYKTRGALAFSIIPPSYEDRQDGSKVLDRYGVLLLEFALPKQGYDRQYDWENKENFALSVHELGEIFVDKNAPHRFTHDPSKMTKNGGSGGGTKVLEITPPKMGDPKPCFFFTFRRFPNDQGYGDKQISVSVQPGEFYVFQRIADYSIPYLLGVQDKLNSQQFPTQYM